MKSFKILVVGNNPIHLMYMMPVAEVFAQQVAGQCLYCCNEAMSIVPDCDHWVSQQTQAEFATKPITKLGYRFGWGVELLQTINQYNPDIILWWNGVTIELANTARIAKKYRRVVFCEVGFFPQREYLYLDTRGINFFSSIRQHPSPPLNSEQRNQLQIFISNYKQNYLIRDESFQLSNYIFVPLQLEADSQITQFSDHFKEMDQLVDFISTTFPHKTIVVKPHPLNTTDYATRWPNVIVAHSVNTHWLIQNAQCVIGINSTVLLEAILYNKQVGALGKGIFTGKDVMLEAHEDHKIISRIVGYSSNNIAREQFLYDLIFNQQIKIGTVNDQNLVEQYQVNPIEVRNWFNWHVFIQQPDKKSPIPQWDIILYASKEYLTHFSRLWQRGLDKLHGLLRNVTLSRSSRMRWRIAQIGERSWWVNWLKNHPAGDDTWLNTVLDYFGLEIGQDFGDQTLLDIGAGPIGILTKLKAKTKIAIDPLSFISSNASIIRIQAQGENIPLPDQTADIVFIYNVLQHVESPAQVIQEASRILKDAGRLYLLEQLNLPTNALHPHSLKAELLLQWTNQTGLIPIHQSIQSDCYFDHPSAPGSGYAIIHLILKKLNKT